MLHTPSNFVPLLSKVEADDPLTLVFHQGRILVREADLAPADAALVGRLALAPDRFHPVGTLDGRYVQAAWVEHDQLPAEGHTYASLRALFSVHDHGMVGVAGRAAQIAEWARTHRFCGACGTPMQPGGGDRSFKCPSCGFTAYPRICPAMMVLIRNGDKVLMAYHVHSPSRRYSPLAGFLEAGESIEEAVHREVYEEVGLRVHNLKYFGSQSWPFPNSLMVAFTADYLDGEIRIDPNELADARWFGPGDEWPDTSPHVSIGSQLVDAHRPR